MVTWLAAAGVVSLTGVVATLVWFTVKCFRLKGSITLGDIFKVVVILTVTGGASIIFMGLAFSTPAQQGEPVSIETGLLSLALSAFVLLFSYANYRKSMGWHNNELIEKHQDNATSNEVLIMPEQKR